MHILARVRAAQHRHAPAHRFGAFDDRGRQRPSEHVLLGGRDRGGAVSSRRCATTRATRRTPTTIASCCRKDTRRRFSTRPGPRRGFIKREDLLTLRTLRLRSRRASDAAAAVGGRRDRLARSGALRRRRHRAQRAPHRLRLPHLRAARRRRDRRRLGLGSGRRVGRFHKLDSLCGSPMSTRSARAVRRSGSTTSTRSPRGGARSAGTSSPSTATTWTRFSTRSTRPGRRRAGRR